MLAATVRCDVSAYLANRDVAGTSIRSAPNGAAPIRKTITSDREVIATIIGFRDGWFLVEQLESTGSDDDSVIFSGQGWIHRSQVQLAVAGGHQDLRAAPSPSTRAVGRVMGDQPGVELLACSGEWVQLRAEQVIGWLPREGQCSNPLTTCP